MKIGYVIHRFPWPSETFISREVADVIKLGYDVEIYSFDKPEGADAKLLGKQAQHLMSRTQYISKFEAAQGIVARSAPNMLREERRIAPTTTSQTTRLLRAGRAAAVAQRARQDGVTQLHAHWPYATQCAHLASSVTGLPYSVSIHAHEVAHDSGHFPACFERVRFATFCNRAAMEYLLSRLDPTARAKSHLVYHGVDTAAFAVQPPAAPNPPLRILSAGRLTGTKGFDRLVRACAAAVHRGIDVQLTILGRGPEEAAIRRIALELNFSERLNLPGWVSHEEVTGHMRACHVFALLASDDFNDGLPNVVVEAMASGRPVIVSPLPAASEIIANGTSGFILSAVDDEDGFIEALKKLSGPGMATNMAAAARVTVEEKYDARCHIRTLASLFEKTK
ncbi:glycosyltransferase family 4 protein [Bradyrhizobium sp. 4]|uniref:glycosyltransferase family 4 protein n=1 Tax=unclassified Bradyrhizobium TaxID=2631580 RepID=UPI001FF8B8F2|nr:MULTISPECIES: glycosyltransferase family 4 protein [unclassified Bradyrhizobium]MCK1397435.1 glycosyltransferase family 4 protein [Bradyrhizobium sp. 39]MCK1752526.1 glycosyltransferase family 4 protein [Bradyrhizobium sp. 135]UPJ36745.1 glycosyltransferase family 4 protein [Bradyrhizobium sp. 4]